VMFQWSETKLKCDFSSCKYRAFFEIVLIFSPIIYRF
jgi:hypothetical protein